MSRCSSANTLARQGVSLIRGVFELHETTPDRIAVAVESFRSGLGFLFAGIWFRRDSTVLWCEAISPWNGPGLRLEQAVDLLEQARLALDELVSLDSAFAAAVEGLTPRYAIIEDLDITAVVIAELVEGELTWRNQGCSGCAG